MVKTKVPAIHQKSKRKQDTANLGLLVYAFIHQKILFLPQWYYKVTKKKRGYPHFDKNVSPYKVIDTILFPEKICIHQFFPLIRFEKKEAKYIKSKKKGIPDKKEIKSRLIYYASHIDALIYSWYSTLLEHYYEQRIEKEEYKEAVIAYRQLDHKSNIHFAFEVFEEIKKRESCVVITIDITQFFDTLDHKLIKSSWKEILGYDSLPEDHYKIYRSLTQFAYVEKEKLYEEFNIKEKHQIERICSIEDFRTRVRAKKLIAKNNSVFGIPQGTPLSACISNIYMMAFDKKVFRYSKRIGAFYRRYSDDIVLVCDEATETKVINMLKRNLKHVKLQLNPKKTSIIFFKKNNKGVLVGSSKKGIPTNLQYLGFYFDGKNILIRSSSLSRYYKKMKKAIKSSSKKAAVNKNNKKIFRKKIYKRFSHLGERNFITYVQFAYLVMKSENIKKQIKNHMKKVTVSLLKYKNQ